MSIVIGVPTIKRDVESYIMETLSSLVAGLSTEEKLECLIVVFIAEVSRHRFTCQMFKKHLKALDYIGNYSK